MTTLRKLLIATDLSADDRSVVQAGLALSAALGAQPVLVHAFTNEDLGYAATLPVPLLFEAIETSRRKLDVWAGQACETLVRVRDPCELALSVAKEVGADTAAAFSPCPTWL